MMNKALATGLCAAVLCAVAAPALAQVPAAAQTTPSPAFATCLARLKGQAASQGVSAASFEQFTAGLQPDMSVLDLLDAQPEFTTPLWDYLSGLVDEQRVSDGQRMLATHRELLAQVSQQYGVDAATVVAVWGVESDYGRIFGKRPLLASLGTLSCFGRRQPFFQGEFIATLKLLQAGDIRAEGLTGSWAGAFGHTQFMPSTYARIAVDGDGDGRRDLVASIPDALASTANYLKRAGWRSGEPWGYEIGIPNDFDTGLAGRTSRRPLSDWLARGVKRIDGGAIDLPADARAAVLLPAGRSGPAFLVFRNYDAIYSYNAAESYALAIALLSDRLRGGSGLVTPWPTDDPGLSRVQRKQLQTLLLARGHAIGEADGLIGSNTRRAIQAEQQRLGLAPADGRAGRRILAALEAAPAVAPAKSTAFALPPGYAELIDSPVTRTSAMSDVPGLRLGVFQGFDALLIETPHSTAAVALFGGQLLSFVPKGGQDAMWLSPLAKPGPAPIRGGTPICWPYFGRQDQSNELPAHGFVRTLTWSLREARREDDGTLQLTLVPPPLQGLPLTLEMTLRIGRSVEQQLVTANTGTETVRFTQALHNYFRVSDVERVSVVGLDGLTYLDKNDNYSRHQQRGDWNLHDPRDPGRSDRTYTDAGGRYELRDPGLQRKVVIASEGSRTLVAWNPGAATATGMADVGAEHWREFVALEPANAGPDVIALAPGQRHVLKQTISVEQWKP